MKDNSFIIEFLGNRKMLNIEEEMNIYHLLTQIILLKIPELIERNLIKPILLWSVK